MAAVKGKPSKRQEQARQTRERIIGSAYDLFAQRGFRATTMESIAEQATVAVQTVYFAFRTKDDLLQAVHEWAVLGDDGLPPPLQSWHVAGMQKPDGASALAAILAGTADINARVAPLIPVFHAVSQDPAGQVYALSEIKRREDMTDLVNALAKKTALAAGMTRRRGADLVFVLAGPEAYRSFASAGWSRRQWVRWVTDTLSRDLFG